MLLKRAVNGINAAGDTVTTRRPVARNFEFVTDGPAATTDRNVLRSVVTLAR